MMPSRARLFAACAAAIAALLLTACDPPGKPKWTTPEGSEIADFKTLFAQNCQGCHGVDGTGAPGRPLNNALYLAIIPKEEIRKVITYGRNGTGMPPWAMSQGGPLTDKQVDALVNGIESWAKPVDFHGAAPPPYSADVSTGNADNGRKLFLKDCFACHGQGAPIGPVTDPAYLSLVSDQLLRTAIIQGWPSLGMPTYQTLNLGHALTDQDIADIVAFLVSKRPGSSNVQSLHTNENGSSQQAEQGNKVGGSSIGGGLGGGKKQ